MKNTAALIACLFFCLVSVRCNPPDARAEKQEASAEDEARRAKVVATVDGEDITVGEVEDKIRSSIQPAKYKERENLKELINTLIDQRLMEGEAMKRGYGDIPNVSSGIKRVLYNLMQTKFIEDNLSLDKISKEEVKKYYDEHISDYNQPSLVRASHIQFSDEGAAKSLLEKAGDKGFDLRNFRQIATEKSEDDLTKKRGGDLRYFSVDGKVWYSNETVLPEIAKAAFSVKVKVRASVIVMNGKEEADEALKQIMAAKPDDAAFKKFVKQLSLDEASKKRGGDIGWFTIDGTLESVGEVVPEKVAGAAFSFQTPGTIVPRTIGEGENYYIIRITGRDDPGSLYPGVVKTGNGYHVIWVVNQRPALNKTIDEVEYSIRQRLWQQQKKTTIDDFVNELKTKYKAKINEDNVGKVVIDLSGLPAQADKKEKKP
ncbi:MAG: peptidyl-prolyl cis-trans isomerase [Pseudomonadota bacterium]